jgi:hypothetical protein
VRRVCDSSSVITIINYPFLERKEAAERQQAKVASKKAESLAARKRAAETAEAQQRRVQTIRSEAFSAARKGDAVKVRKAVWEENVDAAGGEIKPGCETYVNRLPEDPKETLLHIATQQSDVDLVEWLDAHSQSRCFNYRCHELINPF